MRVSGIPFVQGRNDYDDVDGKKYAIAIHNTSNDASDEDEASYAKRRTDGVSSHFYVDENSVTQSLDTEVRAGHAGSRNGNENAIAVEITGANGKSRQWWLDNVDWDLLGRVLADVCKHYGIPVDQRSVAEMKANAKVKGFYGHNDMRLAWGGTTHTDPGPNFPWDKLLASVAAHMGGGVKPKPASKPKPPAQLDVDGRLGPLTISRWQQVMGTPVDGVISSPSVLVRAVQRHLNAKIHAGLVVDGIGIRQNGREYKTVRALQKYLGTPQDGRMSTPVSEVVKAVQRRLNTGRF